MIKKNIGLSTFFHLKNAGRPKRMDHNTCKSMGGILCVVRHWLILMSVLSPELHYMSNDLTFEILATIPRNLLAED